MEKNDFEWLKSSSWKKRNDFVANPIETYGETPLSERSCREWFQKFKNSEFDIKDKKRSGRPKVYEGAELEALLDQDSCQTQEEQYDGQYFE